MDVLVPFSADRPKSRLSDVLTLPERREFARAMLSDVLATIADVGGDPRVLATAELEEPSPVPVTVDDRALSVAVNDVLSDAATAEAPIAVVMSDLAVATPEAVSRLLEADGDLVVAPGRGGGTNALVVRHPEFRVDYHGASYRDHRRAAASIGATVCEVDSFRLATDIDEPEDLVEVLLHGEGTAHDWLVDAGFELETDEGRVGITRTDRS